MKSDYLIKFSEEVDPDQLGDLLQDCILSVEAVVGKEALQRGAFINLSEEKRELELTVKAPAGEAFLRCLLAFIKRDIDSKDVKVQRVQEENEPLVLAFAIAVL